MTHKSLLIGKNLSYAIGDQTLFNNLTVSFDTQKTGLVGANGVGKTTLVQILLGQRKPDHGTIQTNGRIGYLRQDFSAHATDTIAAVLGITAQLRALDAIQAGTGTAHDQEIVGEDWDIQERVHKLFAQLKLSHLTLDRMIQSLSGGETTRVFLAHLLLSNPDFLILDEPTNNLDQASRRALYDTIRQFNGGMLIVSHDRTLLRLTDRIIELTSLKANTYGGNYDAYVEQKKREERAKEQQLLDAQKALKKTKMVVQQTKERYDQRVAQGMRARREGSQPTIILNAKRERSENTQRKLERMADNLVSDAREHVLQAQSRLEQKDPFDFELEATHVHNTKKVLELKDVTFAYQGATPIIKNFNLTVIGPERLAIAGPNGSGKTTLLKLIMAQLEPISGSIMRGVESIAYLDQRLSILNLEQSVLENFKRLNPQEKETRCRTLLAAFLFSADAAHKKAKDLSGGEKMRAALACILVGQQAPQLVLLDEPTNNMDLESIASIENALNHYQGALIAVSHDDTFLEHIGVTRTIDLEPAISER